MVITKLKIYYGDIVDVVKDKPIPDIPLAIEPEYIIVDEPYKYTTIKYKICTNTIEAFK